MTENDKAEYSLDCVGLYCPEPLFQTRNKLDAIEVGKTLEVVTDDPAAEEDIARFAKRAGHEIVSFEKEDGIIKFVIRRLK